MGTEATHITWQVEQDVGSFACWLLGSKGLSGPKMHDRASPRGRTLSLRRIIRTVLDQQAMPQASSAKGRQGPSASRLPSGSYQAWSFHGGLGSSSVVQEPTCGTELCRVTARMGPRLHHQPGKGPEQLLPGTARRLAGICRNYPAVPFKCTATIATDRCSVPAMVHNEPSRSQVQTLTLSAQAGQGWAGRGQGLGDPRPGVQPPGVCGEGLGSPADTSSLTHPCSAPFTFSTHFFFSPEPRESGWERRSRVKVEGGAGQRS